MPRLVLASSSPRRRALMSDAGFVFAMKPPHLDEIPRPGEPAPVLVLRLALAKALTVAADASDDEVILGVDTTIELEDQVLGKPESEGHAAEMLGRLAARTHTVWSGVAVVAAGATRGTLELEPTGVTFRPLTRDEIERYVESGEPMGKAGGYAIQGRGRDLVESLEGSLTNVMGLPMERVIPLLARWGLSPAPAVT